MRFLALVFVLVAASAHADSLTVNQPHRADTYAGDFLSFDPPSTGFDVLSDDAHEPPVPDRVFSSGLDETWSVWDIELCNEGNCGTVRHICKLSDATTDSATLDCLDVDC